MTLFQRRLVSQKRGLWPVIIVIGCFITSLAYLQFHIQTDDDQTFMGYGLNKARTAVENLASKRQLLSPKQIDNHRDIIANDSEMFERLCPLTSPLLIGWTNISGAVSSILKQNDSQLETKMKEAGLELGGHYSPRECRSRHKVAIVIPFRNRKEHLVVLLSHIHFFLQRQQLDYTIFVVEQTGGLPFNRGMMKNIGFVEAKKTSSFDCFFFHDVDLLPEDDRNLYICPPDGQAKLMSYSIDVYDYSPTPIGHFGGVVVLSTNDFNRVNGYSNQFWGWGNEDDDLYRRVLLHNISVKRPFDETPSLAHQGRYIMLGHPEDTPNPVKQPLLDNGHLRMKTDGLIDLNYVRKKFKKKLLYTYVLVDVKQM